MSRKMLAVMQRRGELLARIAAQREQMTQISASWQSPLNLADKGLNAIRFLIHHPALPAGAAALFLVQRRGVIGLIKTGWRVWKGYSFIVTLAGKTSQKNSRL